MGAGPAGCACGYTLAKAGLNALILERGRFAGAKNMWGGAFYGPVLPQLFPNFWEEAPIERHVARHRFSALTPDACLTTEFTTEKFNRPPYNGFTILRSKFDRWFAAKVEQAGAIVASGLQADGLLREGDQIRGIKAGGDEIPADVVVACDGVNSLLAQEAGLRGKISPRDIKQGVKEVLALPREAIEQRFNVAGNEGLAWEFVGSCTRGLPGGAFIYTNKESLSVGVVVELSSLAEHKVSANDLLNEFKAHPAVAGILADGKLVEYSAHLIPVSGIDMMPALYTDGFLVAGDAAAFVLGTGLILEGANFAVASGIAAAETIIRAKEQGDFSANALSRYRESLEHNFVLKDLKTYKKAHHFLANPRIYSTYPELVCAMAERIFKNDGAPREKTWHVVRTSMKGKVSWRQIIRDLWAGKGSI